MVVGLSRDEMMDAYDGKSKQRKETHINMLNWFTCTMHTFNEIQEKTYNIYSKLNNR
jgi:hypothetical protein